MRTIKIAIALSLAASLSACAGSVRLNANKAFLTGQTALKSSQQSVAAVCSVPPAKGSAQCNQAIDLLHTGAQAEAAGFTAQQAANAVALSAAIITLNNLPAQLVALGFLKAE